jgi:hypothetical protein
MAAPRSGTLTRPLVNVYKREMIGVNRLALALATAVALAGPVSGQVPTVRGEVVALECVRTTADEGRGEAHAAHAMTVAKQGEPMAVLAEDGLYIVTGDYTANNNAKLLDFVARRVEAKGTITERDGAKYVNVAAMMVLE